MESKFTLGRFQATDLVTMATLLSKIGLGKVTDAFGKDNVMSLLANMDDKKEDKVAVVGMGIVLQIAEIILGNLEKCQNELYSLLSSISGMSVEEIKTLDAVDFFELIVEVIQLQQFRDFIKVASRLRNLAK